jgi:polysaccharide pyruvyl transferase WcaK-like protein
MHTYCLNYNLGDYALGFGVRNMLRKVFEVSYVAETNLQGQIFDDYFIDIINKKYDLLVIGGGGIIHGAHWPQGWFWLIEQENIKKIKIPFIVYGAGYNYFKDEEGIPERGISHLKETSRRAALFSVRNDGSHARLLEQTGINAEVIADPGFWFSMEYTGRDIVQEDKYIVVQLADDKPIHRFGSVENRDDFIVKLRNVLEKLSKDYTIIFAPHVYNDIVLSEEVAEGIDNSQIINFSQYAFDHTYDAIGVYRNAEFVLGMRGHGQIVPLGFNIPVISLENHDKHRGLMEEFGLGKYNVNVLDKNFNDKLESLIDDIITNKSTLNSFIFDKNSKLLEDSKNTLLKIKALKRYQK